MGQNTFQIITGSTNNCGCNEYSAGKPVDPCCFGVPLQLDFTDIIYHKDNNTPTELDGLGLNNGATLNLVIETIDEKIKGLNVKDFTLTCLRADGTIINTPKQFSEIVDSQICALKSRVTEVEANSAVPITATDSATIDFTTSGLLLHTLTANVKISSTINNCVIANPDGIYGVPQTLAVDYTNKKLSISNGNEVDMGSLVCGVGGFLGNLTVDPVSVDGQYWYNISQNKLKIKVNNAVREITLV